MLILVVGVAGSLYYTPFIEGYKNNSELFKQECFFKRRRSKTRYIVG